MRDAHTMVWPDAAKILSEKGASREPVTLWHRDEELDFMVVTVRHNPESDFFQLERQGVTAQITTQKGTDEVSLLFISNG